MSSDKTATERLRELLDERGVEWDVFSVSNTEYTHWTNNDGRWCAASIGGPQSLHVNILNATPEQAIAVTLGDSDATVTRQGVGTCKDVCADVSEFTCGACGFNCELAGWISLFDGDEGRHRHHYHGTPNFCPNCGRKVIG